MQLENTLQSIQEAFEAQLNLTTFITDHHGHFVTDPSRVTRLVEEVFQLEGKRLIRGIVENKDLLKSIDRPILIDLHEISNYIGLKLLMTPLHLHDSQTYFIWAGLIIEEGYKALIINHHGTDDRLKKFIEEATELTFIEIAEKMRIIESFAELSVEILNGFEEQRKQTFAFQMLNGLLDEKTTLSNRLKNVLVNLLSLEENLAFAAFARSKNGQDYEIIDSR